MGTTNIPLNDMKALQRALARLGPVTEGAVIKASKKTARFGVAAVKRTSASTKPHRPRASGTYEDSWTVTDTKKGSVLNNTAAHAIFVEKGRTPRKRPPPSEAIKQWLILKKIVPDPNKETRSRRKRGPFDDLFAPGDEPIVPITLRQAKARAKATEKRKQKKNKRLMRLEGLAIAIAIKIGRQGIAPKHILKRTLPTIWKHFQREIIRQIRKMDTTGRARQRVK